MPAAGQLVKRKTPTRSRNRWKPLANYHIVKSRFDDLTFVPPAGYCLVVRGRAPLPPADQQPHMSTNIDRAAQLEGLLRERIVLLDGAMGTVIQQYKLGEAQFRGERFRDWTGKDLKGNNELLNLTQPQIIEEIHRKYFEAGADIVETNTFNAQF